MTEESGTDLPLSVRQVKSIGHEVHDRITDEAAKRVALQEERRIREKFRLAKIVAEQEGRKTVMEKDLRTVEMVLAGEIDSTVGGPE